MAELPTILDGAYRLVRTAGSGGTARVYLAEDTTTGQRVAVKVLRKELASQDEFKSRFQREATLLQQINHPNLVKLIQLADAPEGLLLVLEWVEGRRLDELLREQGPLTGPHTLKVLTHVADALAAIHEAGVVHRDLKPENVMVETLADGPLARLLDLGIARFSDPSKAKQTFQTVQGKIAGTPTYLSPEQILAKPASAQSDVYSFGVMAYLLVTGKPPFENSVDFALMQMHLAQKPATPVPLDPMLKGSPVLELILQCLEKAPEARPPNGRAVFKALQAAPNAPAPAKRKWWPFGKT